MLDGIEAQTAQAVANLNAVIDAAGLTPADLAKLTISLTDPADVEPFMVAAAGERAALDMSVLPVSRHRRLEERIPVPARSPAHDDRRPVPHRRHRQQPGHQMRARL